MNLEITNENYSIEVVKIRENNIKQLENSDNLIGVHYMGYDIITQKNTDFTQLKLLITTETELSNDFLSNNNLYRHNNLNVNTELKGYIEDNGRVRAIRLRGNRSNALLLPVSSLAYLDIDFMDLNEGEKFNKINGIEIAKKYQLPTPLEGSGNKTKGKNKKYERIDGKQFPEHFDTENYFRNEYKYRPEDELIITQKLHGTSVRLGHVEVKIKPTLWDKILRRQRYKYDYIAGSRRVIKDLDSDKEFQHYYETTNDSKDIWNLALDKYRGIIPKDTIIYAEIIGYTGATPIQKGYTYDCQPGQFKVYVYRIVNINKDNQVFDWSYQAIKDFCEQNNLNVVPEFVRVKKKDFNPEIFLDINYSHVFLGTTSVYLDKEYVDEGICIRRDGLNPYITKAKSPEFLEHETKLLDKGETNLEDNQI